MSTRINSTLLAVTALPLLLAVSVLGCKGKDSSNQPGRSNSKSPPTAATPSHPASPAGEMPLIHPAELAAKLAASGTKPLLIDVGFKKIYEQAHIPGSEYLGPGSDPNGIAALRHRVANLPHATAIVIYCGCCPWRHCPNVRPAYQALHALGFSHVKVLFFAHNFGADWVNKGYPIAKGA